MTDQISGVTDKAKDTAEGVTDTAKGATGTLKEQTVGAFTSAAKDILGPAIQQMSEQAAQQAANYVKEQGPKLVKEQVLPKVMEATGADNPADMAKSGIAKVGESVSG